MKLNIETAEIEGITRTSQNLKFYEEKYEDKFSGNTRLFHIQFVGTDGKCTARITLTHNLKPIIYHSDDKMDGKIEKDPKLDCECLEECFCEDYCECLEEKE